MLTITKVDIVRRLVPSKFLNLQRVPHVGIVGYNLEELGSAPRFTLSLSCEDRACASQPGSFFRHAQLGVKRYSIGKIPQQII